MADEHGALHDLIRRGRRRQALQLVIQAASFAAVVALAGTILLLIVGAQILSWYWIVALFAAGLGASAYRSRAQLRSAYQVAQTIDRQLVLHDALSTAYYFGQHPDHATSQDFLGEQRRAAENVARSADIQRGMPFVAPRTAYVNLALIAVACGMFGLRYGIRRSLDLGSPLVHIHFDGLFGNSPQTTEARRLKFPGSDGKDRNSPMTAWQTQTDARDPAADAARQSVDDPQGNSAGSPDSAAKADSKANEQMPPGTNPLDSGEKGEQAGQNEQNQNSSGGADTKQDQQQQGAQKEGQNGNPSNGSNENASLGNKLRDALSNLLAKMKPQSNKGGARSNDSSQSAGQRPQQRGERQDGEPKSPGQEQADASANSQNEGEQQQGGTQQASQGKSDGKSNSQPNSPDGKSGIGKQDGDKAAREAAELAAMGKLSEIIGKRAANISGEMMVEVSPGKQQLKTQYSQQSATHTDAGGEINRDEVPLAYQQYVQQYFAQIRKQPAGKSKAAPALPPDAKVKTTPSSLP